jgi:hypothetical protein
MTVHIALGNISMGLPAFLKKHPDISGQWMKLSSYILLTNMISISVPNHCKKLY